MPFFKEDQQTKKAAPSEFDFQCADKLKTIVVKTFKKHVKWNRQSWANEFRLLRAELVEKEETRITNALAWYAVHCQDDKVPPITTGAKFRKHFDWLENVMGKKPSEVEVSPAAQRIVDRIRPLHWPKGSEAQLPQVVQISLANYEAYYKTVQQFHSAFVPTDAKTGALKRFLDFFYARLPASSHFIEYWFVDVQKKVSHWDGWNGELLPHRFDSESKTFHQWGWDKASDYCGDYRRFNFLMEEMARYGKHL